MIPLIIIKLKIKNFKIISSLHRMLSIAIIHYHVLLHWLPGQILPPSLIPTTLTISIRKHQLLFCVKNVQKTIFGKEIELIYRKFLSVSQFESGQVGGHI